MDADRPGHLCQATDGVLDVACGHHHQVGQLVDDHEDERQAPIGDRLPVLVCQPQRRPQVSAVERGVVPTDVAEAEGRQDGVPPFHLPYCPVESVGRLLRVGHRGGEQVRHALVLPHLDPLRIDQDHPHLVRGGTHQDRGDEGIDARGLAGPGRAGDQEVRHGGQVQHDRPAADVPSDPCLQRMAGLGRLGRREDVTQRHHLTVLVGNLDADGLLARYGSQDPDVGRGQGVGDVLVEAGDPRHLHPLAKLEGVAGDGRTDRHVHQAGLDSMGGQRLLEPVAPLLDRLGVDVVGIPPRQVSHGRQAPRRIGHHRPQFDGELLTSPGGPGLRLPPPGRCRSGIGGTRLRHRRRGGHRRRCRLGHMDLRGPVSPRRGEQPLQPSAQAADGRSESADRSPSRVAGCEGSPLHSPSCRLTDCGPGYHRCGHQAHADQDEGGTPGGDRCLQAAPDAQPEQAAGQAQAVGSVIESGTTPAHVEQAGHA